LGLFVLSQVGIMSSDVGIDWDGWKKHFPDKFVSCDEIFRRVHSGARIFVGTACGEPQALVGALMRHIQAHAGDIFDLELVSIWNLEATPHSYEMFRDNLRQNHLFIGKENSSAVNEGGADYTPIFFSTVPDLIRRGEMPIDLSLIQTSLPDEEGNMSLGISVDAVLAATKESSIVAAQANPRMPYVYGEGIVNLQDVDYVIVRDEPLLEHEEYVPEDLVQKIGRNLSRIVEDGATIRVGWGGIPDAVLSHLSDKRHLGLHSDLFTDGVAELMRAGVLDNSRKSLDPGIAVASFAVGKRATYEFLHKNPDVIFKTIDSTNSLPVIASQRNMTAINTALEIDLTGQATAESLGGKFYSGVGGEAEFMRGSALAAGGKPILALPSVSNDGLSSRIVPQLSPGASATLHRGDVSYVVTEYGIANLRGKCVRERAMNLIAISHPKFRLWLLEEARKLSLVYRDQVYRSAEYPEDLEAWKVTKSGLRIFLRPVKISDEPLVKVFFYSLSDRTLYRRFASARRDMPHSRIQDFVAVDFSRDMVILALLIRGDREIVIGLAQYSKDERDRTAELALVVRDDYQCQGVGTVLHIYMTSIAKKRGLVGFTAEVLEGNLPALKLIKKMGFETVTVDGGAEEMRIIFDQDEAGKAR
jgi:acyl-CoA hydrolase/GNAT superfamily N-acetyltransferase